MVIRFSSFLLFSALRPLTARQSSPTPSPTQREGLSGLFNLLLNIFGVNHLCRLNFSFGMAKKLCSELFISKLSFYTSENELKRLFSPFGVVKQARLIRDQKTQRPKGFGFVKFEKEAEAQKALKAMNGRIVQGRIIFVEFAQGSADDANKDS